MRWSILLLSLLPTLTLASNSMLIEPTIGFALGSIHVETEVSGESEDFSSKLNGFTLGGKIGIELNNLHQIGLDFTRKNLDPNNPDIGQNWFAVDEYTAFGGVKFSQYRVYGGFVFRAQPTDSRLKSGDGMKVGFSWYADDLIALGIEMTSVDLRKQTLGPANEVQGHYSNIALLISGPIEIWE